MERKISANDKTEQKEKKHTKRSERRTEASGAQRKRLRSSPGSCTHQVLDVGRPNLVRSRGRRSNETTPEWIDVNLMMSGSAEKSQYPKRRCLTAKVPMVPPVDLFLCFCVLFPFFRISLFGVAVRPFRIPCCPCRFFLASIQSFPILTQRRGLRETQYQSPTVSCGPL
jgi:hypothetical protein